MIPRVIHEFSIDPAYFALRPPESSGGGGDLEERVEHLEECCAEIQPEITEMNTKVEYMYSVVNTLDNMVRITEPEIDTITR